MAQLDLKVGDAVLLKNKLSHVNLYYSDKNCTRIHLDPWFIIRAPTIFMFVSRNILFGTNVLLLFTQDACFCYVYESSHEIEVTKL